MGIIVFMSFSFRSVKFNSCSLGILILIFIKMVHQIADKADFDSQLAAAGNKVVVVDFFATWCGPCKMIAPKIEAMEKEMSDVVFIKVDVEEVDEVAAEYNIRSMPTFVFIKNKSKVDEFSGANEAKLRETIAKHR